jgi:hypothetical protein
MRIGRDGYCAAPYEALPNPISGRAPAAFKSDLLVIVIVVSPFAGFVIEAANPRADEELILWPGPLET